MEGTGVVEGIVSGILSGFTNFINFIPKLFYWLVSSVTMCMDVAQLIFRKLVGLDVYYLENGKLEETGDIIFEIIEGTFINGKYPILNTAFWSIIVLSCILLFITTIAGILKNEYTPDKEKLNSKSGVMKNTLKAVISFVLIPVTCFFGLYIGNITLQAIDLATQNTIVQEDYDSYASWEGGSKSAYNIFGTNVPTSFVPLTGIVFRASAFRANRARNSTDFYQNVILKKDSPQGTTTNFGIFNLNSQTDAASKIDEAFTINGRIKTPAKLDFEINEDNTSSFEIFESNGVIQSFNRYDVGLISYYYNLWQFDFIINIALIYFMGKVLISIVFGLIQRLFSTLALFMICPVVCSFMPLDDGASFRKWRAQFITITLSAYVAVFALNIFFIVFPAMMSITFFPNTAGLEAVNYIISAVIMVAGLLAVQFIIKMFEDMFTVDKISHNIMNEGQTALKDVTSVGQQGMNLAKTGVKTAAKMVGGVAGFATGLFAGGGPKPKNEKPKDEKAKDNEPNKNDKYTVPKYSDNKQNLVTTASNKESADYSMPSKSASENNDNNLNYTLSTDSVSDANDNAFNYTVPAYNDGADNGDIPYYPVSQLGDAINQENDKEQKPAEETKQIKNKNTESATKQKKPNEKKIAKQLTKELNKNIKNYKNDK